ncbi:sulfite exporter TauE/SafE family protein [Desertibaculum subflavum]|uniref:sulfite exporter TauE/SafE family protein n=1 Tax=Desertibaculum subflavum TaxID=2268458 RepID=UPI0034D17EEB
MLSSLDGVAAPTLVTLVLAALIAGTSRGFSGFGAALIFIPIASAAVGPKVAAPLLLVVDSILSLSMVPGAWPRAAKRDVAVMATGTLAGVPTGAWILSRSDPVSVRWVITAMIFALLALLVSGWRYRARPKVPLTIGVGAVAGLFSGLAQVGGPPVVAYWLGGASDAARVRANIVLYFAVSSSFVFASYIANGLLTTSIIGLALVTGPAYGFGIWCGSRLFGRASEVMFRRTAYALIAAAGLIGLPALDGLLR